MASMASMGNLTEYLCLSLTNLKHLETSLISIFWDHQNRNHWMVITSSKINIFDVFFVWLAQLRTFELANKNAYYQKLFVNLIAHISLILHLFVSTFFLLINTTLKVYALIWLLTHQKSKSSLTYLGS